MKKYKLTIQGKIILVCLVIMILVGTVSIVGAYRIFAKAREFNKTTSNKAATTVAAITTGNKDIVDKSGMEEKLQDKKKQDKVNEINKLSKELQAKVVEANSIENLLLYKRKEALEINKELTAMKAESENVQKLLENKKIEAVTMDKNLSLKKTEADQIEKMLKDKQNEAIDFEKLFSLKKVQADSLEKTLENKRAEEAALEKALTSKKTQTNGIDKSLASKMIESGDMEKALAAKKIEVETIEKDLASKKIEMDGVNKLLLSKRTEADQVEKSLATKKAEAVDIERLLASKKKEEVLLADTQKSYNDKSKALIMIEQNIKQKTMESQKISNEFENGKKALTLLLAQLKAAKEMKTQAQTIQTSVMNSNNKRVDVFYSPHPDDEVLSMGMAIAECVKRGDEVHLVLMTHGYDSNAINVLNGDVYCNWHHRKHNPEKEGYKKLTKQDMGNLRVKEFIKSSMDLGVDKNNILICNYDEDSVSAYEMKLVMLGFEKQYPGAYHQTTSYHDAHPFHKKLGEALLELVNSKQVKNAEFYISPVQWGQVQGNMITDPRLSSIVLKSLNDYKLWDPAHNEFGIGYHSYPQPFEANRKLLSSKVHLAGNN